MLEWLESFGNILLSFVNFFISFIKDAILFVGLTIKGLAYLRTVFVYLPLQYQVAISTVIAFSFVLTVLHLGGN